MRSFKYRLNLDAGVATFVQVMYGLLGWLLLGSDLQVV